MFTQGYINGIGSLEKQLVQTTKNLVNKALAELLKLKDFNFSDVAENASTAFSSGVQKQISYMLDRISYQNQQQLKDFDNTMQQLQDASAAEVEKAQADSQKKQDKLQKKIEKKQEKTQTKSVKKQIKNLQKKVKAEQKALTESTEQISKSYEQQIAEQQKMKEAYQQASASMISEFQEAVQEYQTAAQKLIDDTMNSISSDYQSQYDALISKQDNLIQKLKDAGDLFNVSNAGVMTMNDIKAQTQAIRDYASRLEQIKKKVSSDLFDEIAKYDMKEGNAFMDRLLAMSDAELKAYSDAFDEKMSVAESLSKNLYKSDFDTIASNYEKAMKAAFAGLPKQLEQLGYQTMQGFLSGLTTNTAYMEESVKTFISGMVDTFKQQLGIHSPSKVTYALGELVGEGFADGILKMVKTVQAAAKDITSAVTDSLDFQDSLSAAKASVRPCSTSMRSSLLRLTMSINWRIISSRLSFNNLCPRLAVFKRALSCLSTILVGIIVLPAKEPHLLNYL
jgi:acyl transferase domain-containing protein